ncbi:MAG: ribonuclease E/G [Chthoniobacter sp.]
MTERVKRLIGLAPRQTGNKLIINSEKLERRVALLEGGVLEEYSIERETDRNIVGSIFKGRVKNIEHGLKAMFVDIGFEKNAFLHFWDALPAALDSGVEQVERSGGRKENKRITAADIPKIYPVGSEVLVQVTKGPISTKGPRITTNLSLAGRYLVLMPYSDQCGISRKIESPKERDRLRKILKELDIPENMGVIVRTVGEGQRGALFRARSRPARRAMARHRASHEGKARAGLRLRRARSHRAHGARLPYRRNRRGHLRR